MSQRKSSVWEYFEKNNTDEATCYSCKIILKCKDSSTGALHNHLKRKHKITIESSSSSIPKQICTENKKIDTFFKATETLE